MVFNCSSASFYCPFSKKSSGNFDENADFDDARFQVMVVFLVGQTENNETQDNITNESQTYNDLIQEGFFDSYNNLTLKSIMMLKWVVNNCDRKG